MTFKNFVLNFKCPLFDVTLKKLFSTISNPLLHCVMVQLERKWGAAKEFAADHPVIAGLALVTAAMCSVPVLCFWAFAVCSLVFMFSSFMLVEGQ